MRTALPPYLLLCIHVLVALVLVLYRNYSNPFLLATAHTPLRGLTRVEDAKPLLSPKPVTWNLRHFGPEMSQRPGLPS